ncbi:MinD superfamily P-loop ATPase, contains an inserted ferredoxin domain [Peptoclostridium litorale DSM 5388]|uniref:Ferredoxin domain-containing MinD superfamily P-loop ATPase n=1 Tax=Peptoclostridium litorale DSM 5388 TaxID=1121324 RepID=A0A069RPN7_PEPLI|nr:ATP-binding protein [Peptoclostridium litorale]KDR96107.1 ferredoxin domain-containing MinD superfamily P-loop ATPase [Peptoclostridium litorale DSM 5388]SIO04508.1 MinD superfamily P-loop ATPase, contains an inserted ferredoxin domain [Peptoclostridium litorale DSM 5388]
MKQIVVVSGKGGTGKTTIAASMAYLLQGCVKADCDVDASNLHMMFGGGEIKLNEPYYGALVASVNSEKCINCGRCMQVCRFDAVRVVGENHEIDHMECEGCGACEIVCPEGAIVLEDELTGDVKLSYSDEGWLAYADMKIGAEGSGRLVTEVRKKAAKVAGEDGIVIIDGSPGIGCSVMASITGCDIALIVTEPTQSGLSDMSRILSLIKGFNTTPLICINKWDINEEVSNQIQEFAKKQGVDVVGMIPFDETVNKAVNSLTPVVEYENSQAAEKIRDMFKDIIKVL